MDNETLLSLLADLHSPGNNRPLQTEGELQATIAAHLRTQGWEVVEQVACTVGTADLVARREDRTVIIETKFALTRRSIFEAAGQVLAYKAAIDPDADAIVMGYARHLPASTVAAVAALDVTVIAWDQQVEEQQPNARILSASRRPHSPVLRWNVQTLAQSRAITTVSQLATVANLHKQTLYGIWRGETAQVSVQVLGKLCIGLDAHPGDWFEWDGTGVERRLVWNAAGIAARVGLTAPQLAFRSGIYFRMVDLYMRGAAQSSSVKTLSKLARALTTEVQPFNIGELFIWDYSTASDDTESSPYP